MKTPYQVWTDAELADLVREDPALVAIADALAEADGSRMVGRRWRLGPRRRLLLGAAALVAVAAVALASPWNESGRHSLTDRALAAIGSGPVLHVTLAVPTDERLIDLASGESTPVPSSTEIWYDRGRGLKHTVNRSGGVVIGDMLETPEGGYTESGPIYDCAWIAAHPQDATKARVSCNANMENGTTPRTIPRPKPSVDPPLEAFLDGYRDAIARGAAREVDGGELAGKTVVWLSFTLADGRSEEVALDPDDYRPLYVRMPGGGWEYRIDSIESIAFDAADFRRPTATERARRLGSGFVSDRSVLPLSRAALAEVFPGVLWAGASIWDLPLVSIEREQLTSRFGDPRVPIQRGTGVRLFYGSTAPNGKPDFGRPHVQVAESDQQQPSYWWGFAPGAPPPEGKLLVRGNAELGFLVSRGTYVTIWGSDEALVLSAARALEPVAQR